MPARVLVVGNGNREHAIVKHLMRRGHEVLTSLRNRDVVGDQALGAIDVTIPDGIRALAAYAAYHHASHAVVGPETAIAAGVSDALRGAGLKVLGPSRAAARIETSKVFAKRLMTRAGVPTARFEIFDSSVAARAYCRDRGMLPSARAGDGPASTRLVVKADGLAAGKGSTVCASLEEADAAIVDALDHHRFGESGRFLIIEDFLVGPEFSLNGFADSTAAQWAWLPLAQDHKTVGDAGSGPNTGGMGVYVLEDGRPPVPRLHRLRQVLETTVIEPLLRQLAVERIGFRGPICGNLVLTSDGPSVMEFNARFGDPEAEVIMMQLQTDLVDVIERLESGRLSPADGASEMRSAMCVVVAARGYPDRPTAGDPITLPDHVPTGVEVFQGGATLDEQDRLVTRSGRVLAVMGSGPDLHASRAAVYETISRIHFDGMHFRGDIGAQALGGTPVPGTVPRGRT